MARILAGELDPDSPEARDAAARDPRLRAELAELAAIERRLASVGGEMRADNVAPAEGEDDALARFRRQTSGRPECRTPRGAMREYGAFEWRLARPANARFELVIRAADGREIRTVPDLDASTWTPRPEEVAGWPERIRWTVRVVGSESAERADCSAEAWLDPTAPR